MHTNFSPRRQSGFTLIELLVVIAIIAILAAILFPVFARARENARRSSCQSNLKQIGIGFAQYNQDYDGHYPYGCERPDTASSPLSLSPEPWSSYGNNSNENQIWPAKLQPYLKSRQIFACPSATSITIQGGSVRKMDPTATYYQTPYGYNVDFIGACGWDANDPNHNLYLAATDSEIENSASTVLVFDATFGNVGSFEPWRAQVMNVDPSNFASDPPMTNENPYDYFPKDRHLGGMNVAFCDGHVKWMHKENLIYHTAGDPFTSTDPKWLWNRF
jgi:prepilin-type N-terminal cleavage/methylation domain-containing protein/prepilin-type processing-associated H-X9-DG protein